MLHRNTSPTFADLLENEFAQEKASALGRLGRALEAKLAALAQFDASQGREAPSAEQRQFLFAGCRGKFCALAFRSATRGLRATRHGLRAPRLRRTVGGRCAHGRPAATRRGRASRTAGPRGSK